MARTKSLTRINTVSDADAVLVALLREYLQNTATAADLVARCVEIREHIDQVLDIRSDIARER